MPCVYDGTLTVIALFAVVIQVHLSMCVHVLKMICYNDIFNDTGTATNTHSFKPAISVSRRE